MWIINNRKILYAISIALMVVSIAALAIWGLKPGLDFTGGSQIEVSYPGGRPDQEKVSQALSSMGFTFSIRPSGDSEFLVNMEEITPDEKVEVLSALSLNGAVPVQEENFASIGPILGAEALRRSVISLFLVILGIILYITFAFRKVSEPVSSWKYGLVAIVSLLHDIIIPIGVFAVLGHFAGYEVDTLFVTALLVILGFSVHDTIVVFDRVRENLKDYNGRKPFDQVVGDSISQTFTRSINTSLTTLIALVVLYIFGGAATQHFTLALIIGIAAGTYSSIFVGSPLLVTIEKWGRKK